MYQAPPPPGVQEQSPSAKPGHKSAPLQDPVAVIASSALSGTSSTAVLQSQPGMLHHVVGIAAPARFVHVHMYQAPPPPGVQEQSPSAKPGHKSAPLQDPVAVIASSALSGTSSTAVLRSQPGMLHHV